MIESILEKPSAVSRHKQAPLLKEREQFLTYCQQPGTSHKALRNMAAELIAVIRLLRMHPCVDFKFPITRRNLKGRPFYNV